MDAVSPKAKDKKSPAGGMEMKTMGDSANAEVCDLVLLFPLCSTATDTKKNIYTKEFYVKKFLGLREVKSGDKAGEEFQDKSSCIYSWCLQSSCIYSWCLRALRQLGPLRTRECLWACSLPRPVYHQLYTLWLWQAALRF